MSKTSVHIKNCKAAEAEAHNRRTKVLDYVRPQRSRLNEWWEADAVAAIRKAAVNSSGEEATSLGAYLGYLRGLVKEKTGRKMQAKAAPLQEAVVVIDENTRMEQVMTLAKMMEKEYKCHVIQIAIHRDEGRWVDAWGHTVALPADTPADQIPDGVRWKANLHAHLVIDRINHETGKAIHTGREDTAKMQDMAAAALGMERGVASDKKHVDAQRYKAQEAAKEKVRLQAEVENLQEYQGELGKEIEKLKEERQDEEEEANLLAEEIGGMHTTRDELARAVERLRKTWRDEDTTNLLARHKEMAVDLARTIRVVLKDLWETIVHGLRDIMTKSEKRGLDAEEKLAVKNMMRCVEFDESRSVLKEALLEDARQAAQKDCEERGARFHDYWTDYARKELDTAAESIKVQQHQGGGRHM